VLIGFVCKPLPLPLTNPPTPTTHPTMHIPFCVCPAGRGPSALLHTIYAATQVEAEAKAASLCSQGVIALASTPMKNVSATAAPPVRVLQASGPSENRIDVVLMGDGYTEQDQEKCFEDMARLQTDMFNDETFESYAAPQNKQTNKKKNAAPQNKQSPF
jgi:hypothetical protein